MAVGGVAVFPADTVYGLACDPGSEDAVARLYDRHHGVMMLMGWDDKLAGPWLRVQLPVIDLLREIGFAELRLVETASWFLAGTVGLIRTYLATDSESLNRSDLVELEGDAEGFIRKYVERSQAMYQATQPGN